MLEKETVKLEKENKQVDDFSLLLKYCDANLLRFFYLCELFLDKDVDIKLDVLQSKLLNKIDKDSMFVSLEEDPLLEKELCSLYIKYRSSTILPVMYNFIDEEDFKLYIHTGLSYVFVRFKEEKCFLKLGQFGYTKRVVKHKDKKGKGKYK